MTSFRAIAMERVERHLDRQLAVLGLGFLAVAAAGVFFLVRVTPMFVSAAAGGFTTDAMASCGCAVAGVSIPIGAAVGLSVIGLFPTVILGIAVLTLIATIWRTRRTLGELHGQRITVPSELAVRVESAGLTGRFLFVPSLPEGLMTIGFFRPIVVVAESFARTLASDELDAALRHEAAHVRRRDPLRQLLLIVLRSTFGFLPPVRRALRTVSAEIELAADAAATDGYQRTDSLGRAFLKATSTVQPRVRAIASTPFSIAEERLEQLLDPARPLRRHIPLGLFIAGVLVITAVFIGSAVGAAAAERRNVQTDSNGTAICRPAPQCEGAHMSPAPNSSTDQGMCTGSHCAIEP